MQLSTPLNILPPEAIVHSNLPQIRSIIIYKSKLKIQQNVKISYFLVFGIDYYNTHNT